MLSNQERMRCGVNLRPHVLAHVPVTDQYGLA